MKFIKRFFYGICILIVAGCVFMLICALNPSMTEGLSEMLYGSEGPKNSVDVSPTDKDNLNKGEVAPGVIAGGSLGKEEQDGLQVDKLLYEIPADQVVMLPMEVNGKTGFEPVWEEQEQLENADAADLEDSLDKGETGEEFTFDSEFYPYYAMLEYDMQKLYKQIYANALEKNSSFAPIVKVNVNQLKNVFEAVYNDHPEIFWLETGYSCKYRKNGNCVEITLRYYPISNSLEKAQEELDDSMQAILSGAVSLEGDYEKVRYVHNALLSNVEYDKNAEMNQSAYSAMVPGRSVCAGYARAYQYLLQQLDIPCYYCTGYSGEDHAWNIVKLSDGYYNVDVTWDDTEPATYQYFSKSDKQLAGTHVRKGLSIYLPACTGGKYSSKANGTPFQVELQNVTEPVITPAPMKPMTWEEDGKKDASDKVEAGLIEAGVTEDEVIEHIDEYYADCLAQMKKAGSGQKQFTNVVPEILWIVIEREYTEGNYRKGYVDAALKDMEMENFAIQLQVQKLGGGYYRLYHNIATWN